MSKDEILEIVRASRAKGTSSPFVGALDREAEIDTTMVQLESCLVRPFSVEVVGAYYPQDSCEFIKKQNVIAIAEENKQYLLYSIKANKTINRTTLTVVRFAHNATLSSARLLWR